MNWPDYIACDPDVMLGKPVVRGTRITVEAILKKLGAGMTPEEIIEDYPHIDPIQIQAAVAFAAEALSTDETVLQKAGTR